MRTIILVLIFICPQNLYAHMDYSDGFRKDLKEIAEGIESTKKWERSKWQSLFWDLINEEGVIIPYDINIEWNP